MRCAILSMTVINNPISNRLRGCIKVSGLGDDVAWSTKFPENNSKFEDCQNLHEVMPMIANMLSYLDDHGYKVMSTTNISGFHKEECFLIWNLSIP